MTKEHIEQLSIIIETIAFFFVTVDLYGKERLDLLRERINTLKAEEIQLHYKKLIKIAAGLCSLGIILLLIITLARYLVSHFNNQFTGYVFSMVVIFITACAFQIQIIREIFIETIIITISIFFTITKKITALFPIQGIMLIIGAVMFLIAKLIAYFNV